MRNFISCYYSELITPIALEKSKKKKKQMRYSKIILVQRHNVTRGAGFSFEISVMVKDRIQQEIAGVIF